ncbi:MAG: hypothetical protein ABH828_00370 [archaeon]
MPCDFRLKNYCFHPERASGELVAINCVYDWIAKAAEENAANLLVEEENSKKQLQESAE